MVANHFLLPGDDDDSNAPNGGDDAANGDDDGGGDGDNVIGVAVVVVAIVVAAVGSMPERTASSKLGRWVLAAWSFVNHFRLPSFAGVTPSSAGTGDDDPLRCAPHAEPRMAASRLDVSATGVRNHRGFPTAANEIDLFLACAPVTSVAAVTATAVAAVVIVVVAAAGSPSRTVARSS
jgi:hypothetical protein